MNLKREKKRKKHIFSSKYQRKKLRKKKIKEYGGEVEVFSPQPEITRVESILMLPLTEVRTTVRPAVAFLRILLIFEGFLGGTLGGSQ